VKDEVWVLGATGRTGRAVARRLHDAGVPLVLVGRDRGRLDAVAATLDRPPRLMVDGLTAALARLGDEAPGVVVSTVGPFTRTAVEVARACPPGSHYVDVANELGAVEAVLALDDHAKQAGQVLVTGAGFGVLATESVVLRLCAGRPTPTEVRVDALPSLALEAGVIGAALAGTIVEVIAGGGREVRDGRLQPAAFAGHPLRLRTPDGDVLSTGSGPNGELIAAWRASGAGSVIAASTAAPANPVLRRLLPAVVALTRAPGVGRVAASALARVPMRAQVMPARSSWGHARVQWPSGEVREGWLRVGDAMDFTVAVTTEVTRRLLGGEGRPGSYTPGALFGPGLAEAAGGTFVIEEAA